MSESAEPRCALVYVKEAVSQAVIVRTLEKLGYRVRTGTLAEELGHIGMDLFPTLLVAEIDLLASESDCIHMQALKERLPELCILGLRHDAVDGKPSSCLPFRIDGYLEKPLTVEAIRIAASSRISKSPSR